jgi:hypothetical protein
MAAEPKPAANSLTIKGLGGIQALILGTVVAIVGKKLGVEGADLALLKEAGSDVVALGLALFAEICVIVSVIGRARAKGPLSGVVKAKPAEALEEPPH